MRVITGKAKGHRLKAPKGLTTRPMLDRVKVSLFSVLDVMAPIRGHVLDLYAGTGSLGIECLSRGAESADFVEQRAHVCGIISDNLRHTHLDAQGRVHCMPVERFLQARRGLSHYDIIVMDPPYADPAIERTLALVAALNVGKLGARLVIGHSPRVLLADTYPGLRRAKFRQIGDSCFSIFILEPAHTSPQPEPLDPAESEPR